MTLTAASRALSVNLLLVILSACPETALEKANPMTQCDAGTCGVQPTLATTPDAGDDDAGPDSPDAAQSCDDDAACSDGVFCNGVERCQDHVCVTAATPACGASICDEPSKRCDCHMDKDGILAWFCNGQDDDADGDGVSAQELGGDDCDDMDPNRFGGNTELCDYVGHDEDCNLDTVGSTKDKHDPIGDKDGDGYIDVRCINIDPKTQQVHPGSDCNDDIREVHPGPDSQEICDEMDNDCDGFIDEIDGTRQSGSAQHDYCLDADGDMRGRRDQSIRRCGAPVGYVPCPASDLDADCDDHDRRAFPGNLEVCDGIDNDCDGTIDTPLAPLQALVDAPTFDDATNAQCKDGRWILNQCPSDRLWCDKTTALHGCETDATKLTSCRSCTSDCRFSCGSRGCDEISRLAVGAYHSCAITSEGRASCWGRGGLGRLGNDSLANQTSPQLVVGVDGAVAIAAGDAHTCVITGADQSLYCWGDNSYGQLGIAEDGGFSATPAAVIGVDSDRLGSVKSVAAGAEHTCAIMGSGRVACWGQSKDGRLGNLTTVEGDSVPVWANRSRYDPTIDFTGYFPIDDAASVAVGAQHTCIVTLAGAVDCWGDNTYGQLGAKPADVANATSARRIAGLQHVTALAAGGYHTCALANGQVSCWGLNNHLQLGHDASSDDELPAVVAGLTDSVEIAAGPAFSCARSASGLLACWGLGADGALGVADPEETAKPLQIAVDAVVEFATGVNVCALDRDARTFCWGANFYGQLGNGGTSLDPQLTPVQVHALARNR